MGSKKIYLVRHGQTDFNLQGIVQGSGIDSDLNDTGRAQAEAFFNKYKEVPFDKIYTSTLKRSQQSVSKFVELGIGIETLSGLDEICWGEKEGKKIDPNNDEDFEKVVAEWKIGNTEVPVKGGESPMDVYRRQKEAMDHILSNQDEENVLICMHGRAIRILLSLVLETPLKDMDQYKHSNLCLYLLNYNENDFSLEIANDTSHILR